MQPLAARNHMHMQSLLPEHAHNTAIVVLGPWSSVQGLSQLHCLLLHVCLKSHAAIFDRENWEHLCLLHVTGEAEQQDISSAADVVLAP